MCGRFTLITDLEVLTERFNIHNFDNEKIEPQYNIAPTDKILTVINDGYNNRAFFFNWGIVPYWTTNTSTGQKMINARIETIDTKPTFKFLLEKKRCLIIADGFYEWKNIDGFKQPYRIVLKDNEPFAFAGLWDNNSCAIITTKANNIISNIHERMPVILTRENEDKWLNHSLSDTKVLKNLLLPFPEELITTYKVSSIVNSTKIKSRDCILENNF